MPMEALRDRLRPIRRLVRPVRKALRGRLKLARCWQGRLLNQFAMARRKRLHHVTFIGVTGSCGKTTTTSLVGAVLDAAGKCSAVAGIEPGVAGGNQLDDVIKNVLSIDAATNFCVQELSGSRLERIPDLVRLLQPQIGIVTNVGSDHYKNYRSLEATARSKGQLVELLPRTGVAILNADDPHVLAMASRTPARVVTFGCSPDADVRAVEVSSCWPDRLALTVTCGSKTHRIRTKLVGEFWTTSVLAALTCGMVCGLELKECAKRIELYEPVFGRHSVHAKPNGPVYVFDHKAPFWTIAASLAFVKGAQASRRTIVFGTISDYPGAAGARYRRVAREALEVADRVVFVGPQAGHVARLRQGGQRDKLFTFETTYQASAFLAQAAVAGELIYIRGSVAADHLERILLSQLDQVVCWREGCKKIHFCTGCKKYRIATPPPFGVAQLHAGPATATSKPPS